MAFGVAFASHLRRGLIVVAAGALLSGLVAQSARAQQPASAAASALPGGQPPPIQQLKADQLYYSDWLKQCSKGSEPNAKQVCITGRGAFTETGLPMLSTALVEPEGDKKILRVSVLEPVLLPAGARVVIDEGTPVSFLFLTCFSNTCMGEIEASADMVAKMKSGQNLFVQVMGLNSQAISVPVTLADFKKVTEGAPADQKQMEEYQKKVQDEVQKRVDAVRKRLEAQQQSAK